MANKFLDSSLLDKAIAFAVNAHANTERRGKGFPYIVHPMETVEIVATMTNDQELLAAAVLHDTVEDTGVTLEQIRSEFGARVAKLVEEESDVFMEGVSESESWHARKQAAIDRLSRASLDAKMVALGDKLSNARAIYRDYVQKGDELWKIFHVTEKSEHEWHYRGLARALNELAGTFAYAEFSSLVRKIFGAPKPEFVDMADYEESGDGYTAISYNHKGGKTMMKLYAPFIPPSEPLRELEVAWNLREKGFCIPAALRLVTDGKRVGVEFERVHPKKSFARAISEEPDKLEMYAREFARETKKLHSVPCDTELFKYNADRFRAAVGVTDKFNDAEKQKLLAFIDSVPVVKTCVHGDLHIGNIITNGEKNFWIDLSAFGYGDPMFDFGMFYFISHDQTEELTQRLYHIGVAQIQEVWRIFVEEYFNGTETLESVEERVKPFAALYAILYDSWGTETPVCMRPLAETILSK